MAKGRGETLSVEGNSLKDMIAHAKDRVMDDLQQFLLDLGCHYSVMSPAQKAMLRRMTALLALPENDEITLAALSVSYWNGNRDTFWEMSEKPKAGSFVGFNIDDGRVEKA